MQPVVDGKAAYNVMGDWAYLGLTSQGKKLGTDVVASPTPGTEKIYDFLADWFAQADFSGCAFINSVSELGGTQPEVVAIAQRHKQDMVAAIATLLPPSKQRARDAQAIALAVDGAIIRAQFDQAADAALQALERILKSLQASAPHHPMPTKRTAH